MGLELVEMIMDMEERFDVLIDDLRAIRWPGV